MKRETSDITGFIKVTADDGMVLTFYKDEEPIENYVGIKIVHTNREESLENLREITFEQHQAYEDAKEHALHPDDTTENPVEEIE